MSRRGHASTWAGGAPISTHGYPAAASKAGHAGGPAHAPRHYLAQEILAVMSGQDGLAELDDGVQDSDDEDESQKDYYFSD